MKNPGLGDLSVLAYGLNLAGPPVLNMALLLFQFQIQVWHGTTW